MGGLGNCQKIFLHKNIRRVEFEHTHTDPKRKIYRARRKKLSPKKTAKNNRSKNKSK